MDNNNENNNGRKPPTSKSKKKIPKKERVFGANAVQLSQLESNSLLGGIIEKGISENTFTFTPPPSSSATPLPSLLPFPAARHRSHGPHWAPNASHTAEVDGNDYDDEEDDSTAYVRVADFAEPLRPKKKKGLDMSKWRELIQSNDVSNIPKKDKTSSVEKRGRHSSQSLPGLREAAVGATRSVDMELDGLNESSSVEQNDNAAILGHDRSGSTKGNTVAMNVPDEAHMETSTYDNADVGMEEVSSFDRLGLRDKQPSVTVGPGSIGDEQGHMSLESQIDVENRVMLQRMSSEEIAEAQAEIRNRINPELLKKLKKRGLQKMGKSGSSCSSDAGNIPALDAMQPDELLNEDKKESSVLVSGVSPPVVTPSKMNVETQSDKAIQSSSSKGSSLWDIWSTRVEAARSLRFSFDGNVIEGSSLDLAYTADSAAERDYLRTEGDPGAAGYTIKEALALTRSIVPGQRALALHLLASVLSKALHYICEIRLDCSANVSNEKNQVDWEAIWAYAMGPEPELVLSLRLALDDNHYSVVLASVKVIQCILACDVNEEFFNRLEKMMLRNLYTAPVFRIRPDIKHGFLGGGFWKYSTKPSNILLLDEESIEYKNEGEHTIHEDNAVAEQDVAAGLVRMGILPRFCYLLETEPTVALEECILSVLISVARHSPTCARAIWKCERLVQTIVNKFTMKDAVELQASKIKSVTLLRVLAQSCKNTCIEFIKNGFFQTMTWQLYRVMYSIDEWIRSGKEKCKLASELMVEQLRFWKVCVMHGHCINSFTNFFPALCLWLNPPTLHKLIETNVFHEFASISTEAYLVLETLAGKLPYLHSTEDKNQEFQGSRGANLESWCWSDVGPMVDMALQWLDMKTDSTFSKLLYQQGVDEKLVNHTHLSSLLWILSAVLQMLNTVLNKATPGGVLGINGSRNLGKLPDFVAKISLQFMKNGVLNFSDDIADECSQEQRACSFVEKLCHYRHQSESELSIASVCCLHGLLQVTVSTDHLIQLTEDTVGHRDAPFELISSSKIHHNHMFKCSLSEWRKVLSEFAKLVTSEWQFVQHIEIFGRGGSAPGVGVGWGGVGGGFWSLNFTLVQADARLLTWLLKTFHSLPSRDLPEVEEHNFMLQSVSSALALALVAGPGDEVIVQNVLDILLQTPVLKYLDKCILHFLHSYNNIEPFTYKYEDSDFIEFGKVLASHFRNRWLSVKKRKEPETNEGNNNGTKSGNTLGTIPEDMETPVMVGENGNSLIVEWARQQLPLPSQWLLSPIVTIGDLKSSKTSNNSDGISLVKDPVEFLEVAEAGLFLLLGVEAMSSKLLDKGNSPVRSIPLIWKLHALSVPLLLGMDVLEEKRSRYMYGALQNLYGQHLDELWLCSTKSVAPQIENLSNTDLFRDSCLRFQSEINDNYSTFIETLVEQFAAVSYGDVIYGRQMAMYLHRLVDTKVRLATWNALSNARVLELLPPLVNCLSQAEGYLEPVEEDGDILEAYVKSWVSGSLDKAATRNSMTYAIVVHHLSSFIFNKLCGDKLLLRNKLVKSLLRDYSRKQQHEALMWDLVQYRYSRATHKPEQNTSTSLRMEYTSSRLQLLRDSCEGNSQLLTIVEKLKSSILQKQSEF